MERGKMRAGVLKTVASENQTIGAVSLLKTKRVVKQLTNVDQNAVEKRVALKPASVLSSTISVSQSAKDPRRFIVVPKTLPPAVIDIDGEKQANYLNCPDLAPSQYAYLFKAEDKFLSPPNFLTMTAINLLQRQRVIDWMTILHGKFCDTQETLFIAVNYFDRYLAAKSGVSHDLLQTIAAAALYTASKFEEIYPIPIDDLCGVTDGLESVELSPIGLRKMEMDMLKLLRFKLNPPLKNHFLRRCSMAAGATVELHILSKFLIEASMYDPDLATSVKPSLVAATSSYIALSLFGERTRIWDKTMVFYSGYLESEIVPIVPRLAAVVRQLCSPPAGAPAFHVAKKWAAIAQNSEFNSWLNSNSAA